MQDKTGMLDLAAFAAALATRAAALPPGRRLLAALAGPPGAGKSTAAEALAALLTARHALPAQAVPMDGFHYDDAVLRDRGLLARKGAPETFDVDGLTALLDRLRGGEGPSPPEVAVPLFDRSLEISRAGARIVRTQTRVAVVEGNWLLLNEAPWDALAPRFDVTAMLVCDPEALRARLSRRWRDLDFPPEAQRRKLDEVDLPNARRVAEASRPADYLVDGADPGAL
ncbi:nucleoside/nucleotide kinase family protein [uncultured Albimonas sp.]|uniref:nucleoside/nucleotide kinase family protein n=1 Tax=uncultured Albimonas sp. TaxID=1331701 RepID=UPI0030EC4262|tara:strand:- start:2712 stop:3392 length:681 start_codon:yes stop_codon:yes gene_type:complete